MKRWVTYFSIAVLVTLFGPYATDALAQDKRQGLSQLAVRKVQMHADNIGLILSRFSDHYDIPIGFEVATDDDLSIIRSITIDVTDGTVEDVLNSIVNQNPIYAWEIRDDVVNVFPRERNRDVLLKKVLETRLERISIGKQTTRFMLRQTLCEDAAVLKILSEYNVKPANETFGSRDLGKIDRDFSFGASNVSVATVLNRVIRNSKTKYWIIMRYGDQKQYLMLNL